MQFIRTAASLIQPRYLRITRQRCPLCGFGLLLRLANSDVGVRCPRCRASSIHMAIAAVIAREVPDMHSVHAYELSSRGPLVRFLQHRAGQVTTSEYFDSVTPGAYLQGVQCQNVEALTYTDDSFDLCTSTDVFEHVADDRAGFAELRRVLRSGGKAIFTVPLTLDRKTVERAVKTDSGVEHILEPEYHGDRLRGPSKVLAYRNYGSDITERLLGAGFARATIDAHFADAFAGCGRAVVVAVK